MSGIASKVRRHTRINTSIDPLLTSIAFAEPLRPAGYVHHDSHDSPAILVALQRSASTNIAHHVLTNPGNDPEQDSDREPEPPTKAIDKSAPRTGKRNAAGDAPARAPPAGAARSGRQEPASANERGMWPGI